MKSLTKGERRGDAMSGLDFFNQYNLSRQKANVWLFWTQKIGKR